MYAFTYERPATLDEASKQIANGRKPWPAAKPCWQP